MKIFKCEDVLLKSEADMKKCIDRYLDSLKALLLNEPVGVSTIASFPLIQMGNCEIEGYSGPFEGCFVVIEPSNLNFTVDQIQVLRDARTKEDFYEGYFLKDEFF